MNSHLPIFDILCEHYINYLEPHDIYNFYFLYTALQTQEIEQVDQFYIDEFAQNIKDKYLLVFRPIVVAQLHKYETHKRVDSDFKFKDGSFLDIHNLMQKTFRSDMERRNKRWEELTYWLSKLEKEKSTKKILFDIDRINNTTHNTHESILSKFPNHDELLIAFDHCSEIKDIREFRPHISAIYRKMAR